MPVGVTRLLDVDRLDAASATSLYDLGCGFGKLALQAILQYPNLRLVVGVEFAAKRFARACACLSKWAKSGAVAPNAETLSWHVLSPTVAQLHFTAPGAKDKPRIFELRHGDLFLTPASEIAKVDIIICEFGTALPHPCAI